MRKKGQITLFIILGLVLLAAAGVYISMQKDEESAFTPKIEEVPLEFQPLRSYVENCLKSSSEEGLKLIMDHGGYINPAEFGIVADPVDSTNGNGVSFPGGWIVPYWYHLKSDNRCTKNCEFSTERPPLKRSEGSRSIESQLDDYIKVNVKGCTGDFRAFKEEGYEIAESGDIKITSTVLDHDVLFVMEYPLAASREGVAKDIKSFYVRIPVELKNMYELATILSNLQQQYRFLERDTIQLIVGFSGIDEDKLPPMSESRVQFGSGVSWRKSKVKEDIESMLASYMQLLRAENTLNFREFSFGDPIKDSLYNIHMIIPSGAMGKEYDHLGARFDYIPVWPVYLDLNCDGESCTSQSFSQNIISVLGFQRYEFAYDLSFPVMVEIFDPTAFNGEGYYFRYFLEANLRNNEVLWHDFSPLEAIPVETGSMLCDADKRNSGEIEVNVKNIRGEGIDDVEIAYTCGGESCAIGAASDGILKEKFPVCIGGFITAMKDGYVSSSVMLSTFLDKKSSADIVLEPFLEKRFEVRKKLVVKAGNYWVLQDNEVDISRYEQAIVRLERVNGAGEEDYSFAAEYLGNQSIYGAEDPVMKIAPGVYDISIQLISDERLVIPQEVRETGGGFMGIGNKEYTLPKTEINDSWPSGGLKLRYEFRADDLDKSSKIVFIVPSTALTLVPEQDRHIEDIEQLNRFDEYSVAYANSLLPRFE